MPKNKKKNKSKSPNSYIIPLAIICSIAMLIFNDFGLLKLIKLQRQHQALEDSLTALLLQQDKLRSEITQLETDKRLISLRIKNINKRLSKVHKQHDLGRKSRVKNQLPMISLAGYTNAGKSTLFNVLTKSQVYADDKLFATLDSTIRRVMLPASGEAVIADTAPAAP